MRPFREVFWLTVPACCAVALMALMAPEKAPLPVVEAIVHRIPVPPVDLILCRGEVEARKIELEKQQAFDEAYEKTLLDHIAREHEAGCRQ